MDPAIIKLRVVNAADREAIDKLVFASARSLSGCDYPAAAIDSALSTGVWGLDSSMLHSPSYYVTFIGSDLVACGGWSVGGSLMNSGDLSGLPDHDVDTASMATIRGFYTHPDYQRRGLGALLLMCCESTARISGINEFELAATPAGSRLYRKFGYVPVDHIDIEVGGGHAMRAIKMRKVSPSTDLSERVSALS